MNGVNITFDGYYMFHRTRSNFFKYARNDFYLREKDRNDLRKKIAIDILAAARRFGDPDRVILALDSGSWRNEIDLSYRAQRVPDPLFNWEVFWQIVEEAIKDLESIGVYPFKVNNLEADDIIHLWSKYLFKKGEHCVIISNDRDMQQLVDYNNGSASIIVWDNNSRSQKIVVSDSNISSLPHANYIRKLFEDSILHRLDPISFVIRKILAGDGSDNISQVYSFTDPISNKVHNITESKLDQIEKSFKKMYLSINIDKIYEYKSYRKDLAISIISSFRQPLKEEVILQVMNKINVNIKLIHLDRKYIPPLLLAEFDMLLDEAERKMPKMLKVENLKLINNGRV